MFSGILNPRDSMSYRTPSQTADSAGAAELRDGSGVRGCLMSNLRDNNIDAEMQCWRKACAVDGRQLPVVQTVTLTEHADGRW